MRRQEPFQDAQRGDAGEGAEALKERRHRAKTKLKHDSALGSITSLLTSKQT